MARKHQTESHPFAAELRAVDLFADLEDRELVVLASVAREYDYAPGEVVVAQGDQSGRFHLVVSGHAVTTVGGNEVATIGPGDYFGEMAVIDRQPRSATVTAKDDLTTLSLASISVRPLLREHPDMTIRLLEKLCARLRATDARLA
jgi:CRP/FNR family transcriptional regulator, cyclic AMP receptor protein